MTAGAAIASWTKQGTIAKEDRVRNTSEALQECFGKIRATRILIETGAHSPWVSRLLEDLGHRVIVANAPKVRLIYESDRKNDRVDARMLAKLGRVDASLLAPVQHRRAEAQTDLIVVRGRDALVAARTQVINAVRGMVKFTGSRLPASTTAAFANKVVVCGASRLPSTRTSFTLASARSWRIADGTEPRSSTASRPISVLKAGRFAGNDDVPKEELEGIVGSSAPLLKALDLVRIVGPTDSTVLIEGETGTGKELIAHAIHNSSSRRGRPFIKLNCAAIPFDLLESELFGHEKGAFTGAAAQKVGRFELAHQGTLFLDEVGDIPLVLQPKLLRVLQEREFERLGSGQTHRVDVRVIAATHRDLVHMVKESEFRDDLYYRLNVFPIVVPPLRERSQDIPELVSHFVEIYSRRMGKEVKTISPETIEALRLHSWPGNVRELQNLIERAVILASDGVLPNPLPAAKVDTTFDGIARTTLRGSERALILHTLESLSWVIGGPKGAATRLGLKRTTLISKMKKYGIVRPKWPSQEHQEIMSGAECYAMVE